MHRLHYPPSSRQKSTCEQSFKSKRLNFDLDGLIEKRRLTALNDEKIAHHAAICISKLNDQLKQLESERKSLNDQLLLLTQEAQEARAAKARAIKAKQQPQHCVQPQSNYILSNTQQIDNKLSSVKTVVSSIPSSVVGITPTKQLIQQSVVSDGGIRYR